MKKTSYHKVTQSFVPKPFGRTHPCNAALYILPFAPNLVWNTSPLCDGIYSRPAFLHTSFNMGTSSLICVFYNSKFVIAQFVPCDGYPEGQGVEILKFLRCPGNIGGLKNGLQYTYTIDENDLRGRTGAKFLDHVAKATAENRAPVQLTLWFANDLGCRRWSV